MSCDAVRGTVGGIGDADEAERCDMISAGDEKSQSRHYIEHSFEAGEGRLRVSLCAIETAGGWSCTLVGGELPHVGGVVLAVPRPSLKDSSKPSCDIYSIPVPGHLDNEVGAVFARIATNALGRPVSVSTGIHIDSATTEDIARIGENVRLLAGEFVARQRPRPRAYPTCSTEAVIASKSHDFSQ